MAIATVHSALASRTYGPYSHAVVAGDVVYVSGQLPLVPETMELALGGITGQATQTLENLRVVLLAAGTDFSRVLRTTLYLVDLGDFPAVNVVYAEAFGDHKPARSTVQVAALPRGARVEIDLIAAR